MPANDESEIAISRIPDMAEIYSDTILNNLSQNTKQVHCIFGIAK